MHKNVGENFLECWVEAYTGFPDIFKTDSGTAFTSKRFNRLLNGAGVVIKIVPIESSNSMRAGETYRDPLCRIFYMVKRDFSRTQDDIILSISTKPMNDTCGPEGLLPRLLAYVSIPRLLGGPISLPSQEQRMN